VNPQPSLEFTYKEFTDFARRFNQDGLLTAVAQRAASLPDDLREMPYRETPPWALAGLVKASICDGNPYRSTPLRPGDIRMGCYMYDSLVTHELHQPGLNSPFNTLARIATNSSPTRSRYLRRWPDPSRSLPTIRAASNCK
jgi:hypothetical protein